jgi:hypothetical protein
MLLGPAVGQKENEGQQSQMAGKTLPFLLPLVPTFSALAMEAPDEKQTLEPRSRQQQQQKKEPKADENQTPA